MHPDHFYKSRPKVEKGSFKIWWDDEGQICAVVITDFVKELEKFTNTMHSIKLGGIWKGIEITEKDIAEARRDLLRKLEEKWRADEDTEQTDENSKRDLEEAHS
ncbi:MAG: hypothetical protein WED04_07970 [Promethearchaeati archaeon SRVP18_Atabeyarchaeia-1]